MFELIKKLLGNSAGPQPVAKGVDREAHIALCVLLLEAAHVDGECSDEEMAHLVETLATACRIDRQEIDELVAASHRQRDEAIDLFRFTRYLNANCTHAEKIAAMEAVWRLIHLDGRLEAHEDHFAHKLANLLRLTHKELIEAKIRARKPLVSPFSEHH